MKRRDLLKALSLAPLAGLPLAAEASPNKKKGKRALRIAHITDIHMLPERDAAKRFASCLHHIQNQKDQPDVIFSGGDTIMDALEQEKAKVTNQWDLWHSVIKNDCSMALEYCIGNHDVFGLEAAKNDPLYGKSYALEMMKLHQPYRSFDRNGWHFIVLDSTHVRPDAKWYTAKLDEAQMEWLKNDLAATPAETPVLILSHIPIFAACVFAFGNYIKEGNFSVPGAWMHTDAAQLIALFHKHKNVKVCLSGHMHLLDQVVYNDVTYYCNGAVCGGWWKNELWHETPAGYALINLYKDGSFEREYVPYHWS